MDHIGTLSTLIKHIPGCVEYNVFYSDIKKKYFVSFQGTMKIIDDAPLIDHVKLMLARNNYSLTTTDIKESTPGNINFSGFINPVG